MNRYARPLRSTHPIVVTLILNLLLVSGGAYAGGSESWTRWGGPNRNFKADATNLAEKWPEGGPRQLWSREIGEGYSSVLFENGRLYTLYRQGENEVVVALDAKDGSTIWEHRYASSPAEGHVHRFGDGPRSTPLIAGDRIYTIGVAAKMFCLDKTDGKVLWSHDLWNELGGNFLNHGYSSSPVEYKDTVIVLVGAKDASIVAFDKKSGAIRWRNQSFENSYSTPRLLDIDGEEQLVTFMAAEIVAVDPNNGDLKWRFPHENQWRQNVNMPAMADKNFLLLSSPQAGARGLKLTRADGKTRVEEVWSTKKVQFYHGSTVQDGDWVYGSTGTMAPAFLTAINIRTGEIGWRDRGFSKANLVKADGRLIILDEDGTLALATATPQGLTVHSRFELLEKVSWAPPTLVGQTLFARDQTRIVALDLE